MPFSTILFDLDDTLYPSTSGLWDAIRDRMNQYLLERLHIPAEETSALRRAYFEKYGTTLRGLQIHHGVDSDDFLAYVHDLPLEQYIQPDPALRPFLLSLPQRRWIFTNADANHARRVTKHLGVDDCFAGIIDVRAIEFQCKPNQAAYQMALTLAGEAAPERCLILDDSVRNLAPARAMGLYTVLVNHAASPDVDLSISRLTDLRQALPALWEQ